MVLLINHGKETVALRRERVAQIVVAAVGALTLVELDALDQTGRGDGGHGSTGR